MVLSGTKLSKWYGAHRALHEVDFQIGSGEVVGLLGDNGAGKSTLIKILSGDLTADGGEIRIDGEATGLSTPADARRLGVETIYQDLALADNLSISANIFLGLELVRRRMGVFRTVDRKRMDAEAGIALAELDVKVPDIRVNVEALSGGQRQGVAFARALYWDAKVIVMDEPTGALGVPQQRKVLEVIDSLRSKNVGVIFITHNLPQVLSVADRVVVLRQGEVVGERPTASVSEHEIVSMMVGG
jgi:simple sugar transport system ATP-binding protein